MNKINMKNKSLKAKLIYSTLSILAMTMIFLSSITFFHWRKLTIEKEIKRAESVTEAFSVFVLNTIIYGETLSLEKEYIIDSYISDFMKKNNEIKYIRVHDNKGILIAADNYAGNIKQNIVQMNGDVASKTKLFETDGGDWLINCSEKLLTGKKNWGILTIGFSGEKVRNEISSLFRYLMLFQLIILIVLFILLTLFINKITSSLITLTNYVEMFDLDSEEMLEINDEYDEVGVLTKAFLDLKDRLKYSKNQLIKAEKQVYHAEKLASIGRLASGVAHEINNPLNGIKSCLFSIKRNVSGDDKNIKYVQLVEEATSNIETVVKKLLGFSRKHSENSVDINLNNEIKKVIELIDYKLNSDNIELKISLDENIKTIKGDPLLVQEVLMNLLINAYDSLGEKGEIKVKTESKNSNLFLKISDNGHGIKDKDFDKIFDPFFTTKEEGKGTGLGLSVVLSIVQSLNGELKVNSKVNVGTEFVIKFKVE